MGHGDPPVRHHDHQITQAQFEAGVPAHAPNDDLSVEVPSFEQTFDRDEPLHLFIIARHLHVCTRTLAATLPPEQLLSERPTNYRRWWNNSWFEVEERGQRKAGKWTPNDARRLRALVDHAHSLGYWIRFYTLDGFAPQENRGWDDGYNFGSREAVKARWKAALEAGVDLIATDQYENLRAIMRGQ
jgi:hypothetical protein